MKTTWITLVLATALAGSVSAQAANITEIGTGCTTPEGVPTMNTNGLPVLGQNVQLFYTGPNHRLDSSQSQTQPILVIGFGTIGPVDVPQFLFPFQPTGCSLLSAHDIVVPMQPDLNGRNTYENSVTIAIGNDPALLGGVFFAQWLAAHTQCGIAGCLGFDWIGSSETAVIQMGT